MINIVFDRGSHKLEKAMIALLLFLGAVPILIFEFAYKWFSLAEPQSVEGGVVYSYPSAGMQLIYMVVFVVMVAGLFLGRFGFRWVLKFDKGEISNVYYWCGYLLLGYFVVACFYFSEYRKYNGASLLVDDEVVRYDEAGSVTIVRMDKIDKVVVQRRGGYCLLNIHGQELLKLDKEIFGRFRGGRQLKSELGKLTESNNSDKNKSIKVQV